MPDTHSSSLLDTDALAAALRRWWLILLASLVLGAAIGYVISSSLQKKYTATASLLFNTNLLSAQLADLSSSTPSSTEASAIQDTNVALVQLAVKGQIGRQAAAAAKPAADYSTFRDGTVVSAQSDTNIVQVAVTATSAQSAADLANSFVRQFTTQQNTSTTRQYRSALAILNRRLNAMSKVELNSTTGEALQDRVLSLSILSGVKSSVVNVAAAATPPSGPSAPKTSLNTALGAILLFVLTIVGLLLRERLDRRIKTSVELAEIYNRPLLGVIRESPEYSGRGGQPAGVGPVVDEAFRLLRARLQYFNVDRQLKSILITSSIPGEGKTTVGVHLAAAAAAVGNRVIFVEADLRRPVVSERWGLEVQPGLSDVLAGLCTAQDAVQQVPLEGLRSDGPEPELSVIVAGAFTPPNASELLESQTMQNLLNDLTDEYDLVVVDTPPVTVISDAMPLLHHVNGVIVVGRVGRSPREAAHDLRETLDSSSANVLGIVANCADEGPTSTYGYAESYARTPLAEGIEQA
jgi:capsular exopolysaccharide synthesis family protein